jgi:hypothetical protein
VDLQCSLVADTVKSSPLLAILLAVHPTVLLTRWRFPTMKMEPAVGIEPTTDGLQNPVR